MFVLSGGAVRGAAQVGMLREVLTAGIVPDAVVAVSAGALNGLPIANDPSLAQVEVLELVELPELAEVALGQQPAVEID